MRTSRALVTFTLFAAVATPATAALSQSAQPATWTGTLTTGAEPFSGGSPPTWLWDVLGIRRAEGRTSLGVEGIASRRFDQWDHAIAGEAYAGLAASNYGYLRAQFAPNAKVLPGSDLSGELYQSFAHGWEGSVGLRRMNYTNSGSTIGSVGVGANVGTNYLRARYIALFSTSNAGAVALTARHYLHQADSYAEAGLTTGHEVVNVGPNQTYDVRASNSGYAREQYFLTPRFGLAGLLSFAKQRGIPERTGIYLSVMSRW